ncbi:nibrin [Condylostylus longicornis]|uniref:nibrin n=1 Tax=Condylostylus longicornis TaxID=2530218 RepID=UPI00244E1F53|nr:nibrin [Condylostylus longicornis]
MWKAVSKSTGDVFYMLPEKEKYTVGRQNSDLNIKNDSSISRNHAYLLPSLDYIEAIDVGSKFNTYCNENIENKIPMEKNQGYKLKDGERIKFGQMDSEYVLTKMKIVTVPSALSSNEKQILAKIMSIIRGQIEDEVTPKCTHLTMSGITITIKLLHALLEGISIVNLNFWKDYLECLRSGENLPDPQKYIPDVAENFMNITKEMLSFKEERKTLFREKIFVFLNKNIYEIYNPIITKAGGQTKILKNVPLSDLIKKNIVVIQNTSTTQSEDTDQLLDKISEYLKKHHLRLIPDYEIGIALVNCSIQKYCNAQYSFEREIFKEKNAEFGSTESQNNDIIARETPLSEMKDKKPRNHLPDIEIPESVGSAVYDLTESDAEESEKINSENIDQDSQEVILNIVAGKENKNMENNKLSEKNDDSSQDLLDKPSADFQNKRKREASPINNQNKKINLDTGNKSEFSSISKSNALSGFLEKSLIRKNVEMSKPQDPSSQCSSQASISQKKRGRFANLDSDGDDEGDLFDFGKSKSKKSRPNIDSSEDDVDQGGNNSENELFNIRKTSNSIQASRGNVSPPKDLNEVSKTVNSTMLKNGTKQGYTNEWKKSNVPEEPILISGWLCKKMIKIKIKDENDQIKIKDEISTTDDTDITCKENANVTVKKENQTNWIESLNGGFQVRVKEMHLISKCPAASNTVQPFEDSSSTISTTNGKNFKAFTKKQNFIPQKEILTTVPHHVTGFSF